MTIDLNSLIPTPVKIGLSVALVVGIFWGGWYFGSASVQDKWDKANLVAAKQNQDKKDKEQAAANSIGKIVEDKLTKYEQTIQTQQKELSDAAIQLDSCSHQPIPSDSVRYYRIVVGQ